MDIYPYMFVFVCVCIKKHCQEKRMQKWDSSNTHTEKKAGGSRI